MKIDNLEGGYSSFLHLNNQHTANHVIIGLFSDENKVDSLSIEDLNTDPKIYLPWTQTKKSVV